ncbi:hypothetical protein CEXT_9071 [Caerostris extrusa]|uniref:Uncharacterized protein n=1 Tax=Caerostris extrusa TaxID=172846 RepID=A0AAV4UJ32_CAEEX|nr:hypothetical protein CEXT_9071 [Caerostris extrusa]
MHDSLSSSPSSSTEDWMSSVDDDGEDDSISFPEEQVLEIFLFLHFFPYSLPDFQFLNFLLSSDEYFSLTDVFRHAKVGCHLSLGRVEIRNGIDFKGINLFGKKSVDSYSLNCYTDECILDNPSLSVDEN